MSIDFDYPDTSRVWGVDVSFWNDVDETPRGIDFLKLRASGCSFVIIRAGQNTWIDSDFAVNWKAAKEAGLLRGAYWFLDARVSANGQARLFADLLRDDPGEIRPTVDYEHVTTQMIKDKKGKTKRVPLYLNISQLDGFIATLNWPVLPIIYTGPSYWHDNGSTAGRYSAFPLWIANYKTDKPIIPSPWADYTFWQFSETGPGRQYGAESNAIDLNYYNGTKEEFLAWVGNVVTLPPEPPAPPSGKLVKITDVNGAGFLAELPVRIAPE